MATQTSRVHLFYFATYAVIMFFIFACSNLNITDVKESKDLGGQVTLSWDFVNHADFYNIYYGNARNSISAARDEAARRASARYNRAFSGGPRIVMRPPNGHPQ